MKCIMTLSGVAEREMKILRVSDEEAKGRVASGEAVYVSKEEWKRVKRGGAAVAPPTKAEADYERWQEGEVYPNHETERT